MTNVLVTGGTGYLAGWVIKKLMEKHYAVRTTVRSPQKGDCVKAMLQHLNIETKNFSYVLADLTNPKGWDTAMQGIDYVLHVASPLGGNNMDDPSLIDTAKSGVTNVISAAINNKVKKIVMTSSEAANYPPKSSTCPNINENLWTDVNNKTLTNYMRSKVIAEKTAWELIRKQEITQLVTILPGAILGPFMDKRHGSTDQIFQMLLKGTPSPNVIYPVADVRDLADLHILAMENEKANGQRFIAEAEEMTMPEMAKTLKNNLGERGKKVSTVVIPDFVVTIGAKFNPAMKVLSTMIGLKYHRTNQKALSVLAWKPRSAKETVIDATNYLIKNDLLQ